ncbi:hypothetical protein NliqN6_4013 [Naganishia liquefaciens]|uniref:Uncharacterized protein n=1 Tax=Naganishia liquefaciens TaxID=104408 RepID=A0A8H3YHG1_9TREE|nr:hypothetical protein NliqN6_4013 [Naganishia liquefaciens]
MSSTHTSTGSNAGSSLGNMVKDSAKVVGGLGDAIRGNINSFADSAVDSTPKAQHNAATGATTTTSGGVERRTEAGDKVAAGGADTMREGLDGLRGGGKTY